MAMRSLGVPRSCRACHLPGVAGQLGDPTGSRHYCGCRSTDLDRSEGGPPV